MRRSALLTLGCLALLACLALSVPAWADTIDLNYHGGRNVQYYIDDHGRSGLTSEFYTDGEYAGALWFGYCIDPAQLFNNQFTAQDPEDWEGPGGVWPAVEDVDWMQAAWIMENFAPGVSWLEDQSSVNYGNSSTTYLIQAIQLAIWETVMDPSGDYLTNGWSSAWWNDGRFTLPYNNSAISLASNILVALNDHLTDNNGNVVLSGNYDFLVAHSNTGQDILLATVNHDTPSGGTPEPGTLLLMGSALGAVGWFRRRKNGTA
ncbi:MAG: PEP-CTERM sorting domain-containing protein [Deltaproteobacteria bacterium]|nr:PEP-CTERM sorting domain-containing protein [Deltaproteobacteria bacterium]